MNNCQLDVNTLQANDKDFNQLKKKKKGVSNKDRVESIRIPESNYLAHKEKETPQIQNIQKYQVTSSVPYLDILVVN